MKRLLIAAAVVAVVAYAVLGAYHFFDLDDADDTGSPVVDTIRSSGPGWQR